MFRITITHIRDHPGGTPLAGSCSTTTTLVDEYQGGIEGLAARLAQCRAAVGLPARELDPANPPLIRSELNPPEIPPSHFAPAPVTTLSNGATVSTAPRPVESWTGRSLYNWAMHKDGALDWVQSYGREHGFPRKILEWSPSMCSLAHAAYRAEHERSVA